MGCGTKSSTIGSRLVEQERYAKTDDFDAEPPMRISLVSTCFTHFQSDESMKTNEWNRFKRRGSVQSAWQGHYLRYLQSAFRPRYAAPFEAISQLHLEFLHPTSLFQYLIEIIICSGRREGEPMDTRVSTTFLALFSPSTRILPKWIFLCHRFCIQTHTRICAI